LDAYINWVGFRVTGTAFNGNAYPNFACHDDACASNRRRNALRRDSEAAVHVDAQGFAAKFSGPARSCSVSITHYDPRQNS
jgi:hypothetical protein